MALAMTGPIISDVATLLHVEAARRRRFLPLVCPGLSPRPQKLAHACPCLSTLVHPPSPCTACLPWTKGLGRTLLRIDSIGTKLRECVLLSPLGPEAL